MLKGDTAGGDKVESEFKNCVCQGKIEIGETFRCGCMKMFHVDCVGSSKRCLLCKMGLSDPFKKVMLDVGSFVMDWRTSNHF